MAIPRWLAKALKQIGREIDRGRLDVEAAAELLVAGDPPRRRWWWRGGGAPALPPLFAYAAGIKEGRPAHVGAFVQGMPGPGMAGATGVPLAIGLELLARGELQARGVLTPEQAIDPDAFFDALAPHCTPPFASGGELVQVASS